MAELIAQGPNPTDTWRRPLPGGQPVVLGRADGTWAVPWEPFVSRRHAQLTWADGRLRVEQLPAAPNPIFVRGSPTPRFELTRPGDCFVIGNTTFTLDAGTAPRTPDAQPVLHHRVVGPDALQKVQFHDAPRRLDVLHRLPEVISGTPHEEDLFARLADMLLTGIPRADGVALVEAAHPDDAAGDVRPLHQERRLAGAGAFTFSRRLVREALRQQKSVLSVWETGREGDDQAFTVAGDFDWAFCTPVRGGPGAARGLYVAGHFTGDPGATLMGPWETNELGADLKFTELVAAIWGSLQQVKHLERKQASLAHFFSPAVLHGLFEGDPDQVMRPRETDVAVLFCDLRGFASRAEKEPDLLSLLERVSKALGVMTQNILDHGGVIGDFHGDAAMGFWGWPLPQPDAVPRAVRAALGIRSLFEASARRPGHPLQGFRMGIGLVSGRAVAGGIGSADQLKVTVFGPVVNLAARLESMTKIVGVSILTDADVAGVVRERMTPQQARVRRLARVKPFGLSTPLVVSELLPPFAEYPELTDEHLARYEEALDAFLTGEWDRAITLLHALPAEDRGKDFLMRFILLHERTPPPGWDGVIPIESKG